MSEAVSRLAARDAAEGLAAVDSGPAILLRPADLFAISVPLLFASALISSPDRTPELWNAVAGLFAAPMVGLAARYFATRHRHPLAQAAGSYYIILCVYVAYGNLNPLIDRLSPVVYDRDLQAIDQFLFGVQPSVWLEQFATPWLTELCFIAYALFFFWQLALGTVLFFKNKPAFHDYVLLVVLFYLLSDVMYVMVPAIGPRFDLADEYVGRLQGLWLASSIEARFIDIPMVRDCFPSGHTGLTLLTLYSAWRAGERRFFAVMLVPGLILIFSTLYCRFHYAIDLMCAPLFITGVLLIRHALKLSMPDGVLIPLRRRSGTTRGQEA